MHASFVAKNDDYFINRMKNKQKRFEVWKNGVEDIALNALLKKFDLTLGKVVNHS